MFHFRLDRIAGILLSLILLLIAASPVAAAMPSTYISGCTGEYFNNTTLTAPSVTTRTDGAINFFWPENTSPAAGVYGNNYSVRWTCGVNFPNSDNYTFTVTTDDGMNVLVDGRLVLWAFYDQGPTTYYPVTYINSGYHTVTIEYYNRVNAGTARVSYQEGASYAAPYSPYYTASTSTANWYGEYFNNQSLSGSPVFTRNDSSINFNWGTGSPDGSVPVDHWSARWTASPYFAAGTWQFTAGSDDGLRLWVDSTLLIDRWYDQSYNQNSASITLGAGNHTVRLEYYDDVVNAQVSLSYYQTSGTSYVPPSYYPPPPAIPAPPAYNSSTTGVWHGQFYNNIWLTGSPAVKRDTDVLNYNWGEGRPFPGVNKDFSAKWDSVQIAPYSGNYLIQATSDDGVRLSIDGSLVIDGWYDHLPTNFSAVRYLTAGPHNVHVDYYDSGLGAMINVQITGQ